MKKKSAPGRPSSGSAHEPQRLRAIAYEPEYLEARSRIERDVPRAEEALEAVESFLSRRAEMGLAIRGYDPNEFATWLTKPLGKTRIRVLYHYDDSTVTLIEAWLVRASPF